MQKYRDNGAIGALLDEYEKALNELILLIKPINNFQLTHIVDPETKDQDCRSIQTILSHVLSSGYNYVICIRQHLGEEIAFATNITLHDTSAYIEALQKMFSFNEQLFSDYPDITLSEKDATKQIRTKWNHHYDVETLFEHAIVHILRHRRQIERFLLKIT